MRKLLVSVAALALTAGAAAAADLPSRKGPPVLPPPPPPPMLWTGFYAGLNAGYNFGTNDNVVSGVWGNPGPSAWAGAGDVPAYLIWAGNFNASLGSFYNYPFGNLFAPQTTLGSGLALSGVGSNNQSGFIGGGQIGYNYQWGSNFVIGIEADMQGTAINGVSRHLGAGADSVGASDTTGAAFVTNAFCVLGVAFCQALPGAPLVGNPGAVTRTIGLDSSATGITNVNSGVHWLGTVRGRLGYLFTPAMLVYATGGLTYGGAYANVTNAAVVNTVGSLSNSGGALPPGLAVGPGVSPTFLGGGSKSQTLVGWNVGGGLEWMFMPNWSLKAEAIYWNMGNMNVPTFSTAAAVSTPGNPLEAAGYYGSNSFSAAGGTRVNYQGVIARAGVNYHFNWGGYAPVVAKY